MITRQEITKGQEIPADLEPLLADYLERINKLRAVYGKPMLITSGYRSREHNAKIGGSPNSAHCVCQAADFADSSAELKNWLLQNIAVLTACELYCEDFSATPTWVHIQSRPVASGNRIFKPGVPGAP